jgi:primosomal protein N' (replication factor Y)
LESDLLLSVAVPRPLDGLFTYRVKAELRSKIEVGGWVKVPFGRASTHAFIVEEPKPMSELQSGLDISKVKEILEVGEGGAAIPLDVLQLSKWASEYYFAPLGEVLNAAAPAAALGLKSQKKTARPLKNPHAPVQGHTLTPEQLEALAKLEENRQSGQPWKNRTLY